MVNIDIDKKPVKSLGDAIEFLEDCKDIHQDYADNPEWCTEEVGDAKWHQGVADRYEEINQILNKLNGGKK